MIGTVAKTLEFERMVITLKLMLHPLNLMGRSTTKLRQIEDRLESLEETMEVLVDSKLLRSIKRALDDIEEGRYKDYANIEQFRASFDSRS